MAHSFPASSLRVLRIAGSFLFSSNLPLLTSPPLTLTQLIHSESPLMLISLWPVKNRVHEVGQHSSWGPEATCMHLQNNRRVPLQRSTRGWMIFQPHSEPQRQPPTNPGAAGEGSAQRGLFLKTRAHGRKRRGGGNGKRKSKQASVRLT